MIFSTEQRRLRTSLTYAVSIAVICIPSFLLFIADPDRFWFDNFGYHQVRAYGIDFPQSLYWRLETLAKLIVNPQVFVPLGLAVAGVLYSRTRNKQLDVKTALTTPHLLAALTALLLAVVYLLPHPILQQYFVQVLPFTLLTAVPGLDAVFQSDSSQKASRFIRRILPYAMGLYILGFIPYAAIFIGGVRHQDGSHRIPNVLALSEYIREHSSAGPVLSEWAIIPILTDRPGVENLEYVGFEFPLPFGTEKRRHYRLPVNKDLRHLMETDAPRFYVVTDHPPAALQPTVESVYERDTTFMRYIVYQRR